MCHTSTPDQDFLSEVRQRSYGTILADPPWQFSNRTGKMAPEHRRLSRYPTLTLQAIKAIPVAAASRWALAMMRTLDTSTGRPIPLVARSGQDSFRTASARPAPA